MLVYLFYKHSFFAFSLIKISTQIDRNILPGRFYHFTLNTPYLTFFSNSSPCGDLSTRRALILILSSSSKPYVTNLIMKINVKSRGAGGENLISCITIG